MFVWPVRSVALTCAIVMHLAALPAVADAQTISEYNKVIKEAGFEPVYPATSGLQPGFLYSEQRGGDGKTIQTPLCGATFATKNDAPSTLSVKTATVKNTSELSLALGVDPAVLGGKADVSADLKKAGASTGSIVFGAPQKSSIPALVSAAGAPREVLEACQKAIAPFFGANGRPTRTMYMVVSTLGVDSIAYNINVTSGLEVGLKSALEKILKLTFGYKKTSDTSAQIVFSSSGANDRRIVGVTRIRITQLNYNAQVSQTPGGKVAAVKSSAVPVTETAISLPKPR